MESKAIEVKGNDYFFVRPDDLKSVLVRPDTEEESKLQEQFLKLQQDYIYPGKTKQDLVEEFESAEASELGGNYPFAILSESGKLAAIMTMRARARRGLGQDVADEFTQESDAYKKASQGFPTAVLVDGVLKYHNSPEVNWNWRSPSGYFPFIELGGVVVSPEYRGNGLFTEMADQGLSWVKKMTQIGFKFPFPDEVNLADVAIAIVAHGQFTREEVLDIRHELVVEGEVEWESLLKTLGIDLNGREVGRAQADSTASEYLARKLGFTYVGASITGPHLGGVNVRQLLTA